MTTNTPSRLVALTCKNPAKGEKLIACSPTTAVMAADATDLPTEITWMPRGDHEISAGTMTGGSWSGLVRCDELGASVVIASYERSKVAGHRVWLDCNHDDGAATADVRGFSWDPARGIIAKVEWTPLGESCLKEKRFFSFSPTFWVDWESGRVAGLVEGHAAGGLVNAPAFGAAMPALIIARLGGAEVNANPAPDGSSGSNQNTNTMNRELMLKILAALAVTPPADATDEQLNALVVQATSRPAKPTVDVAALQAQIAELKKATENPENAAVIAGLKTQVEALTAAAKAQKKAQAEAAVQAAVERGALKAEDTAVQAQWVSLLEADDKNAALLAALPGKPKAESVIVASDVAQRSAVTATITREGLVDALKAYAAEKNHQKRSGIYASTIAPAIRDRSTILGPILASNSLGGLTGDLIVQRALTLLKLSFPQLSAISTDFSDQGASYGQTITTRTKGIPEVATYIPGTGYATSNATTTDVDVTINNHKAVPISFNANELASTNRDIFGEQAEGAHYALGKALLDAVYALITPANFTNETVSALVDFKRSKVSSLATDLYDRGVPDIGRFLLLRSTYFDKLQQDSSLVSYAAFQRPELLTKYMLPEVAGMQPYMAVNLPTTDSLVGFGGTSESLVLATRTPNDYTLALPGASNGSVSVVTNPDTGISVQLVQYVDHDKAAAYWRIALMYGVAVGNANTGQRLVSAATGS